MTDRAVSQPSPRESESRILRFQPRGSLLRKAPPPPPPPQVPDLAKFERAPEEPDDYRHRMIMNVLGLAITVMLVAGGIWLADVMAHMRKDQDCVLTGRRGCTPVDVPIQPR